MEKLIKKAKKLLQEADSGSEECKIYNNGFIDGIKYAEQQLKNCNLQSVTNRTFSVNEVKILLEKQKQACANEFIHAEMTMEQAKRRVLNAPTVSF